jgi:hypothetical protein
MAACLTSAGVVALLPSVAGAADYCVAPNTSCDGGNVATLEFALDLADQLPNADRIFLGAGTYTAPTVDGFAYYQQGSPVEIVGQGVGHTVVTAPAGGKRVLELEGGPGSSIHDLTIRLPQNAAGGAHALHTVNLARRIEVVAHPTQANPGMLGVELQSRGALEDSAVTLAASDSTGAELDSGGGVVRRTTLAATTALRSVYGGAIERSRLIGRFGVMHHGRPLEIDNSLVRFENTGITAYANADSAVHADGVTLVGAGIPGSKGVDATTSISPSEGVAVTLANSIIRGAAIALKGTATGVGEATFDASYMDYDPSTNVATGPSVHFGGAGVTNTGDARFVAPAEGDYRLQPGSPLVDAGDPSSAQGLDLDGHKLVADGNGDGTARRDLGAFELQPGPAGSGPVSGNQHGGGRSGDALAPDTQAPMIGDFRATPSTFAVARARTAASARVRRGTRFRFTVSEPSRVALRIQRVRAGRRPRTVARLDRTAVSGSNRVRFTGRVGRRVLRPGRYRAVLTATDGGGNRSPRRTARFRIVRG